MLITSNKGTDSSHRFSKSTEVHVHFISNTLEVWSTATITTDSTETVSIINEKTETVFVFELADFSKLSLVTRHTEYTFSKNKNSTASLFAQFLCVLQLLFEARHIIVLEHIAFSLVKTDTVNHASVTLAIINNYVVSRNKRFDCALTTLVTKV